MRVAAEKAPALGFAEKLSYGCGDFGYSLAYNMVSAFLLYYYTVVLKLPAAAVGTLFLTARLFDAVIDIGVGILIDRTRTRWGRTRPYFLFTALPYCGVFVAIFLVPNWGIDAQLAWAFVTFNLLGVILSFGSIPYTALLPMMTEDTSERLKLGSARSIGTSISVILGTAATMPLVGLLGQGNERRGFLMVAVLFAVPSLIALTALFRNCRERVHDAAPAGLPVGASIGEMFRNRAWWVCFLFALLYFVRFGAMISSTAFFAINVLGRPWMIAVMLPAISGMLLLSAFIAPPVLSRVGIRKGCFGALVLSIGLFAVLPMTEAQPAAFLAIYFAASIATSMTITGIFTMAAESVDYHEARFGVRNEGLLSSGISLATKIGMAIGTAAIAYVLAYAGFAPEHVSDTARTAIRWSYYGAPLVLLALQAGVILFWPMEARSGRQRATLTA